MAKSRSYKHYSLMVGDGGQLISGSHSQDTAGATNYVEKINFRRESDGEVRREGWSRLISDGVDISKVDAGSDPIRKLHQFESPEGKVLVAASGDKLYRLDSETNQWLVIASGLFNLDESNYTSRMTSLAQTYDLKAKRWEVVSIDGYCIFNNGVDLPLIYRADWPCAFPIYSLRERGIVRVGTISEFDGRLFIADVEYFDETLENNFDYFMGGADQPYYLPEDFLEYDDYVTTYRVPHIIEFSAWRLADDQREARACPNLFGQNYKSKVHAVSTIETVTSLTSISLDYPLGGSKETGGSGFEANVYNPYHTFTEEELQNLEYEYSTFVVGDSIRMTVTDITGSKKVLDARVSAINSNWEQGKTYISLSDAYHNTETGVLTSLGEEQDQTPLSLAVGDSVEFLLLKEPDIFSQDESLAREASDSIAFPEDGSTIFKMVKLADKLMVHRQTGYLSISRGDKYTAFYYEERYRGERIADLRHTIINIDSQRQMFVGLNGVFTISASSVEPQPFPQLMQGPEFWRLITLDESEYVFASENSLTQEIFIACPIRYTTEQTSIVTDWGVVAYDLLQGTVSQIDHALTAMCSTFPMKNFNTRKFFLCTHIVEETETDGVFQYSPTRRLDSEVVGTGSYNYGGSIMSYGYGSSSVTSGPYREFARDGHDYECTIKFGKTDLGDRFSEKKMRSYALHMSDIFQYAIYSTDDYMEGEYTDITVTAKVKLSTFSTTQQTETEEVIQELDDLSSEVMIPVYAQGNYYQDSITLSGKDQPFKVLGRTMEVFGVKTRMTSEVTSGA